MGKKSFLCLCCWLAQRKESVSQGTGQYLPCSWSRKAGKTMRTPWPLMPLFVACWCLCSLLSLSLCYAHFMDVSHTITHYRLHTLQNALQGQSPKLSSEKSCFVASSPSGRQARPAQTEGDTGQRPVSQIIPGEQLSDRQDRGEMAPIFGLRRATQRRTRPRLTGRAGFP
jgi:hypothetical protein